MREAEEEPDECGVQNDAGCVPGELGEMLHSTPLFRRIHRGIYAERSFYGTIEAAGNRGQGC
jgi:hypothetical protein